MRHTIRGGIGFDTDLSNVKITEPIKLPTPERVSVKLSDTPIVADGDDVKIGDILANVGEMPLLCPISGKVSIVDGALTVIGDGQSALSPECMPFDVESGKKSATKIIPDEFIKRAHRYAISDGYGGSLARVVERSYGKAYRLVVAAFDCEPGVVISRSAAIFFTDKMIGGIKIVMASLGITECTIVTARGDNGAEKIKSEVSKKGGSMISCLSIEPVYPSDERHLLYYLVRGKEYSPARAIEDSGLLFITSDAAVSVYDAFVFGKPCVDRLIYACGKLIIAPLLTPISELLDICGHDVCDVVENGSMRGKIRHPEDPIGRFTRNISEIPENYEKKPRLVGECISCTRCALVCPIYLRPDAIAKVDGNFLSQKVDDLLSGNAPTRDPALCIGCGCCDYVCPAHLPLTAMISKLKNIGSNSFGKSKKEGIG